MNEVSMPDKIQAFKEMARTLPQVEIQTQHFLLDGMYVRQTFIPAGSVFVGRRHKKDHYFMCLKGSAQITMDDEVRVIKAGMTLLCLKGTKRAGLTLEDSVFAGVFRTDCKDLQAIEDDLAEFDPTSRYGLGNQIIPLQVPHEQTTKT